MRQNEIAKELGISKSYLSMILSGQRRIPEHLEKPLSELVHKNQIQTVPSKQWAVGSSPARDATELSLLIRL
jgi:transcriptional regulator with XRE-family HTH domain